MQRLNIIYAGLAHVVFANSSQGGAVCEILIPMDGKHVTHDLQQPDRKGERA